MESRIESRWLGTGADVGTRWLEALARHVRFARARLSMVAADVAVLLAAYGLACGLRYDFSPPPDAVAAAWVHVPLVVGIEVVAIVANGIPGFIWRFVGLSEVKAFVRAAAWSLAALLALRFGLGPDLAPLRVPVSIAVMDVGLAFGGMLGVRVLRRLAYERGLRYRRRSACEAHPKKKAILVGADDAGVIAARALLEHGGDQIELAGFVDDDPAKLRRTIAGLTVHGAPADLPELSRRLELDHIIVTPSAVSRSSLRRLIGVCESIPLSVRILPDIQEVLEGRVEFNSVRNVELEDLLGRNPVDLDDAETAAFLAGSSVLVTGAGGSIGSELARQVARHGPSRLVLLERAEFALFEIAREVGERWPDIDVVPVVADAGDESRMRHVFGAHRPEVVVHAAAHKHVPLMEYFPCEAVANNALVSMLVGRLAGEYGARTFVLISTDKAVRPSSVMGASKRLAELFVQGLAGRHATRFATVRFGNVIGSAGSVIPIFKDQIRKGGPVTVTHPEMVRYFMTIPEAAQLVLRAAAMGGNGKLFVLDMGEPVRILELAEDTIRLSGLRPFDDIEIVFTGMRPGEKLSEELESPAETLTRTSHSKIFAAEIAAYPPRLLELAAARARALAAAGDDRAMRRFLSSMLPDARIEAENPGGEPVPDASADDGAKALARAAAN